MKVQSPKRMDSCNFDSMAIASAKSSSRNPLQKGTTSNPPISWDPKGKLVAFENSKKPSQSKCYKCQGFGHFAYNCSTMNLLIEQGQEDSNPDVNNYVPDFDPSDDDWENPDDRASFLWFLPAHQTEEEKVQMSEMRVPDCQWLGVL